MLRKPFYLSKKIHNCLLSLVEIWLPSCYNDVKRVVILTRNGKLAGGAITKVRKNDTWK